MLTSPITLMPFCETSRTYYSRLSEPAPLTRCLPGCTQNANESIMLWFGTFVQNTNGMGGKELQLHLHQQHYILAVVQGPNTILWPRLALVLEPLQKKEVKREIERECHKQRKELRDNTKSTDLPRAKQGKGMRP